MEYGGGVEKAEVTQAKHYCRNSEDVVLANWQLPRRQFHTRAWYFKQATVKEYRAFSVMYSNACLPQ